MVARRKCKIHVICVVYKDLYSYFGLKLTLLDRENPQDGNWQRARWIDKHKKGNIEVWNSYIYAI